MYIPKSQVMNDREEILSFIRRFSFGSIITNSNGIPTATHLPFVIKETASDIVLESHFAKSNLHWREIEKSINLIIFQAPHAYISPKHYENRLNVPTWNYIAVHLYGTGKIIVNKDEKLEILHATIQCFDAEYLSHWSSLPEKYRDNMLNGIVAFRITINDIQARKKASQNKSREERMEIIRSLEVSPNEHERLMSEFMNREEKSDG